MPMPLNVSLGNEDVDDATHLARDEEAEEILPVHLPPSPSRPSQLTVIEANGDEDEEEE